MADAKRDNNYVPTKIAVLNTDGSTIVLVKGNPTSHAISVNNNTTGSDNGPTPIRSLKDNNGVSTMIVVSEVDGVTPVVLYANSNGELLIDSN